MLNENIFEVFNATHDMINTQNLKLFVLSATIKGNTKQIFHDSLKMMQTRTAFLYVFCKFKPVKYQYTLFLKKFIVI